MHSLIISLEPGVNLHDVGRAKNPGTLRFGDTGRLKFFGKSFGFGLEVVGDCGNCSKLL